MTLTEWVRWLWRLPGRVLELELRLQALERQAAVLQAWAHPPRSLRVLELRLQELERRVGPGR